MLTDRLKTKGSFYQNFAITLSWNTLAVVAGFLYTPFLARLYTPEVYGLFGVYLAIAQNVSLVATLQLPRAYTLAETEDDLSRLLCASVLFTTVVVVAVLLVIVVFKSSILVFFNIDPLGNILYLLPFTILLFAVSDIYRSWNIRYKNFKRNAVNQFIASVASRSLSVLYALIFSVQQFGLIFGDGVSKVAEVFHLGAKGAARQVTESVRKNLSWSNFRETLIRFKNYPAYVLPGSLVAVLLPQMPLFFFTKYFSAEEAGYFSLANSMLNIPVVVLAGAIAPVFLQKISEVYLDNETKVAALTQELANKLFYLGVFPILMLTVFGDVIFAVVFGRQWIQSGVISSYMGIYFLLMIINVPLLSVYRIYKREQYLLLMNVIHVIVNLLALYAGFYWNSIETCILAFSISNVCLYIANMLIVFSLTGASMIRSMIGWAVVAGCVFGLLKLLRLVSESFIQEYLL